MPSDRDPNQIVIGAGRAGADSVGLNSLLFDAAVFGQDVTAADVDVITPPTMTGENVQEIIDEYWALIPDRPNFLDEVGGSQFNDKNPVGWTFDSTPSEGFYDDSGATPGIIVGSTFDVELTLFPADRGVLAVKVDGSTHVSALKLPGVFTEGSLFSTSVPARILAQNDYTAGSNSDGTVGGLPQNVDLESRVPMERDYTTTAYPGVLYPYEDYRDDFQTFQLARATLEVDLSGFANQGVTVEVVHYRDEAAFNAMSTNPNDLFGLVDLATLYNATNSATTFFFDDGTGDAISITASSYVPTAGTASPTAPVRLSGLTYYGSDDTFDLTFSADGVWDNSFRDNALMNIWGLNDPEDQIEIPYTDYNANGIEPDGDSADYSDTLGSSSQIIGESHPTLLVFDGLGGFDSSIFNSSHYMWAPDGTTFNATTDIFASEAHRYPADTSLDSSILPNGSGSTWDSTAALGAGELLLGGVTTDGRYDLAEGGALKYPDTNYNVGFTPTSGQQDYSSLTGDRSYLRSLDLEEPVLTGKMTLVANRTGLVLENDIKYDGSGSFEGHSNGIKVEVAPCGFPGTQWQDVGREYGDGNGAALSWSQPSIFELELEFKLFQYPQLQSGYYPVALRITIFDGAPSQDIEFFKVDMTPTL